LFEKSAGRIFGYKQEVTGGEREFHNDELRDLYSSPNIIRMIKQKTMRFERDREYMGEIKNAHRLFAGNLK
jgi:hypothetical protein